MTISNNVRKMRLNRGLTQQDLAKMMDTTVVSISRYERESSRINIPLLARFSVALKCSIHELISDDTNLMWSDIEAVSIPLLDTMSDVPKGKLGDKEYLKSLNSISFKRNFVKSITNASIESLIITRSNDQGMYPTIKPQDYVFLSFEDKSISDNRIYLVDDGSLSLRRVSYSHLKSKLELICDNAATVSDRRLYPTVSYEQEEISKVEIIARVVAVLSTNM